MKQYLNEMTPYLIAETAYTFEGDKEYLLKQTNALSDTVNAIKYHMMINLEGYMVSAHPVYEPLKEWLLSNEDWHCILTAAKERGLDTVVLVDDIESIELCKKYHALVDAIEIHAACVNDVNLLTEAINFAKTYDKVFVLGISGFEIQELFDIVEFIKKASLEHVLFMYGFQNYPTDIELINLNKIPVLEDVLGYKVGFADHTEYSNKMKEILITTSYTQGSNFQEVHYVLEEGVKRTDYITGVDSDRLANIIELLKNVHKGLGSKDFRLNDGEKKYLDFRKVPLYAKEMKKGEVLTKEKVYYKRVEKPIRQNKFLEIEKLYGKTIKKDVLIDEEINLKDYLD